MKTIAILVVRATIIAVFLAAFALSLGSIRVVDTPSSPYGSVLADIVVPSSYADPPCPKTTCTELPHGGVACVSTSSSTECVLDGGCQTFACQ